MEIINGNMQQRHKRTGRTPRKRLRYRLPEGISALREDLGDYLRTARKNSCEYGSMGPRQFADVLGVRPETLSRIDNDSRWPSLGTLERYLDLLGMELSDVATKSGNSKPPLPYYPEVFYELGKALEAGRRTMKLTLRVLSDHTGISYSQLSRLTRGHFKGGRHVEVKHYDGVRDFGQQTLAWFTHPVLDYLAEIGGFKRETGKQVLYILQDPSPQIRPG